MWWVFPHYGVVFSNIKITLFGATKHPVFRLHVLLSFKERISCVGHVAGHDTKPFGLFRCPKRPDGGDCSQCPSSRPKSLTCLCDGIIVGALEPRLIEDVGSGVILPQFATLSLFPVLQSNIAFCKYYYTTMLNSFLLIGVFFSKFLPYGFFPHTMLMSFCK